MSKQKQDLIPTGADKRPTRGRDRGLEKPKRPPLAQRVPAAVYGTSLLPLAGEEAAKAAVADAEATIKAMNPKDPVERMLVEQILLAHARTMRLSQLANQQNDLDGVRIVNEYADKASNTTRRLALALAEYRRPAKAGKSVTTIGQANIAAQQVVQNGNATNEQGCADDDR